MSDRATDLRPDDTNGNAESRSRQPSNARRVVIAAATASLVLAGLGGWLAYGDYQAHRGQRDEQRVVAVGRQAALNLTTIDFNQADADVARILGSATGTFLEDFQARAQPFVEAVKQSRSKSEGAVTEAGLESMRGDRGQILVAVQVKFTDGAPAKDPRDWRMRIDVERVGDDYKVANVTFVP